MIRNNIFEQNKFHLFSMNHKQWTNWSGEVKCHPKEILFPFSEKEISDIVKRAATSGLCVRVVGTGHSFTPVVATDDVLISLDNFQGIEKVDKDNRLVTIRSGTKLKMLGELLFSHGFAQENMGDINAQSIAGAISTGTHGTGINFGSISTQVAALTLVTGTGGTLECSEKQNTELFKAAQVSIGTLGIITKVTLRVVPAFKLKYSSSKEALGKCLNKLEHYKTGTRNFEFYWFPYTETVQVKLLNETKEEVSGGNIFKPFNDYVLENGLFYLLSEWCRIFPSACSGVSAISAWGVSTGIVKNYSHKIFATPRLVKFNEMEYNIPAKHFTAAISEIKEQIEKQKIKVHFPVECRFAKGDDIWLSPAYGRESAYIAVHMYKGMPFREYFAMVENIFKKYEGRPHWGKMHTQSAKELSQSYPKWEEFSKLRRELDPKGVFMNEHLKKIFGD